MEATLRYPRFDLYDELFKGDGKSPGIVEKYKDIEDSYLKHSEYLEKLNECATKYCDKANCYALTGAINITSNQKIAARYIVRTEEIIGTKKSRGNSLGVGEVFLQLLKNRLNTYPSQGRVDTIHSVINMSIGAHPSLPEDYRPMDRWHLNPWACIKTSGSSSKESNHRPMVFPFLVAEMKRGDGTTPKSKGPISDTAQNQRIMYSIAAARFFASMNLTEVPVYGLATAGPLVTVTATWCTKKRTVGFP